MKYITEALERQSAELIDLAAALDMPLPPAVLRGTREAIYQPLRHRDSSMVELGRAIDEAKKTEARTASRITALQAIADSMAALPMTIETDRFEGPYLKGEDFTLQLRNANERAGSKLVVQIFTESRSFPRKKDGTFSMDKVFDLITETRAARAASIRRLTEKENQLNRFREIVKPYKTVQVYETQATFIVSQTETETASVYIQRCAETEDRFLVHHTTVTKQTVTAEELKALLAAEVKVVVHG